LISIFINYTMWLTFLCTICVSIVHGFPPRAFLKQHLAQSSVSMKTILAFYRQTTATNILWTGGQCVNTFAPGLIQAVRAKTAGLHVALCENSSGPVSATDLVKSIKNWTHLVVSTWKKFFAWGVRVFCEWRHKWRTFRPPWPTSPGPGLKLLDGSISLKFLLETRLQSEFWYFGWLAGVSGAKVMI